jgi:protein-tyrosine phosphatase
MTITTWCNKYLWNAEADTLTEIIPDKLYLGNWKCAYNCPTNVQHIINMTPYIPNFQKWKFNSKVTYMENTAIDDNEEADVLQHFETTFDFIENVAKDKAVLVHCVVGASRSSSVVIAYLMKKNNWDVNTALEYARSRRSVVKPNAAFLKQLHEYGKKIGTEQ